MDDVEIRIISELSTKLRELVSLCQKNDLRGLTERQIFLKLEKDFTNSSYATINSTEDLEC